MSNKKLTDGLNDRPKDAPIGQTADGLPDDTSIPVEVDDRTVDAVRNKLKKGPRERLLKEVKQEEDASRVGSE
ncbi:hypothetical protein [Pararhizobium arenae]|uniref:hypothetical protein n=1 Tax=Pararhizobium arenae TaxID=1856850 RepID=UPI00094AF9B3|nr:hypothetical protein [Pararhizobium arenae]